MATKQVDPILADIARSGLTAADAKAMRLKKTARGYQIPYFDLAGKPTGFFRERLLAACDPFAAKKEKPRKYRQDDGTTCELYLPPIVDWMKCAGSKDYVFVITEGEKKVFKAQRECNKHNGKVQYRFIGIGGVSAWGDGEGGIHPMLYKILPEGATVYICNDSDSATNLDIVKAQSALARKLVRDCKALVYVCAMREITAGEKCGLDDYLVQRTFAQWESEIVATAGAYRGREELYRLNEEVAYIQDPGLVYRYENDQKMEPTGFHNHHYSNRLMTVPTADGKTKTVNAAAEWMKWEGRAELRKMVFEPGQLRVVNKCLNLWSGWGVEPIEFPREKIAEYVGPFIELLRQLFDGKDPEIAMYFLQWLAYPFQHPGAKMAVAALLWGTTKGTGKTLLGQTIRKLYGRHGTELKDSDLEDPRNSWAEGKQFCLADDITGHDNRKLANRLKTLVTQELVRLDIKYVAVYDIPDRCNYLFTSNEPNALYLEPGDRRFLVVEVTIKKLGVEQRKEFLLWRDHKDGLGYLLYYLMHYVDLTGFDPMAEPPHTKAKEEMEHAGRSEVASWVSDLRSDPPSIINGHARCDLFTAEELFSVFEKDHMNTRTTPNALARELKRAGCKQLGQFPIKLGDRVVKKRLWAVTNETKWMDARTNEIIEHYQNHHSDPSSRFHGFDTGSKKTHD
jgi:hypothetical protein